MMIEFWRTLILLIPGLSNFLQDSVIGSCLFLEVSGHVTQNRWLVAGGDQNQLSKLQYSLRVSMQFQKNSYSIGKSDMLALKFILGVFDTNLSQVEGAPKNNYLQGI